MKQRTKDISIILAVLIVAVIAVAAVIYKPQIYTRPGGGALGETYTNIEGQTWGPLPEGTRDFQVVSEPGKYPQFISGVIDPVKVAVGDLQKMKIVVADDSPVTSVIAEIETDNDTVTVPLILTGSKAISTNDLREGDGFIIDNSNKLIAKNTPSVELISYRLRVAATSLREKFLGIVSAASVAQYTYEGEWTVRDTSNRTYRTVFAAKDELGRERQLALAWSDPVCGLRDYGGGSQSINAPSGCTISNGAEGTEDGNTGFAGAYNVNLTGGAFVWNPGYSVSINNGGSFTLLNGGSLSQGYMYLTDYDCDTYAPPAPTILKTFSTNASADCSASHTVRVSSVTDVNDCYDYNWYAKPGSAYYGIVNRGDGSFDYDCNGSGNYASSGGGGRCDTNSGLACTQYYDFPLDNPNYTGRRGYTTSVSCGASGTYVTEPGFLCYGGSPHNLPCQTEPKTNTCIAPSYQYLTGGECHSYSSFCPGDPIPGASGATGFTTTVSCGNTASYISDPGGCFPSADGIHADPCVTQPSGTYYQGCR